MKLDGNILVADDNTANQMLMQILLEKMGLKVSIAENGKVDQSKSVEELYDDVLGV